MKKTTLLTIIMVTVGLLALSPASNAGSLEPSGPPGSTMKTLDEVEPRKPISSVPHTIADPGSYYLAGNAETTSSMFNGITIYADNVTLDLMGFSLIGDGTAGKHGVVIEGAYKNITIRNGTITNWGGNGIHAATATRCRVEELQVIDNTGSGIYLPGAEQVVRNCVASDNGGPVTSEVSGIYVGDGSTVTGNTANSNSADDEVYGIHADSGCTVTDNTVSGNTTSGASGIVHGIYTYYGGTVTGNTVYNNGTSAGSSVYGILVNYGSTVAGNTVNSNGASADGSVYGIFAFRGSTVTGNTAYHNGISAGGDIYGIYAEPGSKVTGNTAHYNGASEGEAYGIKVGDSCTVTGNTAYLNADGGIRTGGYCLIDQNTTYQNGDGGKNMVYSAGSVISVNNVANNFGP